TRYTPSLACDCTMLCYLTVTLVYLHSFPTRRSSDLVLVMNRMGIATVSSGGREQILREQEAILVMGNEPGSYYRPNQGHSLTIRDRKSTRLNSSHRTISYAVFCLKKKNRSNHPDTLY